MCSERGGLAYGADDRAEEADAVETQAVVESPRGYGREFYRELYAAQQRAAETGFWNVADGSMAEIFRRFEGRTMKGIFPKDAQAIIKDEMAYVVRTVVKVRELP